LSIELDSIKSGEYISSNFLVLRKEKKLTRTGKPYCDLLLGHRTGAIAAKIWDINDELYNTFEKESVVEITGTFDMFNGQPQIRVESIAQVNENDINYEDFLPSTSEDIKILEQELFALINSLKDVPLRRLLDHIFSDTETLEAFLRAPAAKNFHHPYLGGLIEHTISVVKLCDAIARNHPSQVNRDLLVAGALLHDIGKTREFSYLKTIDYSTEGRLIGHHILGYELVKESADALGDIPDEVILQLTHLILSHHGSYENQSPRKPKTLEALLLHLCDDADAKINAFKLIDKEADEDAEWSSYNKVLERFVYLKKLASASTEETPIATELDEM